MKTLMKNYFWNASYQILMILVPFITTPYIARVLGPSNLGQYAYTLSIVNTLIIIGMVGIPLYGNRQIAMVFAKNREKISDEFWSIYLIQLIMSSLSIIFYFLYSFWISDEFRHIYILQGINLFALLFDISWLLLGLQKIKQTVIRNFIVKILSVVLIFLLVKSENDLDLYILIISGSTLLGQAFLWAYSKKYINLRFSISASDIKKHIKPVSLLFLPGIIGQLYLSFDKIILNYYSNSIEVGYYDQAMKIVKLSTTLITSLGAVVLPSIATEFVNGNIERIHNYIKIILRYILFITIPMVIGLFFISDSFVIWFLGENFLEVALILKILSPTILFISLGSLFGIQILTATNQNNKFVFSISCGAIISMIISLIFVPRYGMYATAASSLVAEIIVTSIELVFIRNYLKLEDIKKSVLLYLLSGLVMAIIIIIINSIVTSLILKTIISVIFGATIYIIILLFIKEEFIFQIKKELISIIKSKIKIKS